MFEGVPDCPAKRAIQKMAGSTDDLYKPFLPLDQLPPDATALLNLMIDKLCVHLKAVAQPEHVRLNSATEAELKDAIRLMVQEGLYKLSIHPDGSISWLVYSDGKYRPL